ncbi:MAG: LuxR C-terminal-related transcriptional regulator [Nocardioidaceae bacterium]
MSVTEQVVGREAVAERWADLQSATRHSLEMFVKPPYSLAPWSESESLQDSLLRRGGGSRVLYAQDALDSERMCGHVRQMRSLNEQSRVVSRLPLKIAIVDRRTALVCRSNPGPVDMALTVRESPVLDGLIALFETTWQRGVDASTVASVTSARSADEQTVLRLLAQGTKDEAIARQLGISTHTVRRRIASIMLELGVTSRFQAGLVLGRQGWSS